MSLPWNFRHRLLWKLSCWQLPVQSTMKKSSKWNFRYSEFSKVLSNEMNMLIIFLARLCSYINGLMQKRRASIANALELRLFCIKPSIYGQIDNLRSIIAEIYASLVKWNGLHTSSLGTLTAAIMTTSNESKYNKAITCISMFIDSLPRIQWQQGDHLHLSVYTSSLNKYQ